MVIYSGFTNKKWWFSIVFCMFTRGYVISYMSYICSWWNLPIFCASGRRSLAHLWWLLRRLEISSWSDAVPERRRVQVPAPETDLKSSLGIKNPRSWSQSKKPHIFLAWYPYDIHMISMISITVKSTCSTSDRHRQGAYTHSSLHMACAHER